MTVIVQCPHCRGAVSHHTAHRGTTVMCPNCRQPFTAPHAAATPIAPAAPAPAYRQRRVTSLRLDHVCLRPHCGATRTVSGHEVGLPVTCRQCSNRMVSRLEMLRNLDDGRVRARFHIMGGGLADTDEGRRDAEQFVRLCVAHVRRGVEPRVAVAAELAPLGTNRTSGTAAMRAFLASCGFYEWLYEEALLRPDGDRTRDQELDVLEAILDHPLYRNDELRERLEAVGGEPFATRDDHAAGFPDLLAEDGSGPGLPRFPGDPDNPFTTLDNSRPVGLRREPTPLLPTLKLVGVALIWVVALGMWLVVRANRDQKAEKKDDAKPDVTAPAPLSKKGEGKQPGPPRPHTDPKSDSRPKTSKTEPVKSPVTFNDAKTLRATLDRCVADETALSDFNTAGAKSTFRAENVGYGPGYDAATIMKGEMCITAAKYDPARQLFVVTAVPSLLATQRDAKRQVGWPTHYLVFNCPATKDEADRYAAQFEGAVLVLDAEYKLRKVTPIQEESSAGAPQAKVVTSYLIETEIQAVKLGAK